MSKSSTASKIAFSSIEDSQNFFPDTNNLDLPDRFNVISEKGNVIIFDRNTGKKSKVSNDHLPFIAHALADLFPNSKKQTNFPWTKESEDFVVKTLLDSLKIGKLLPEAFQNIAQELNCEAIEVKYRWDSKLKFRNQQAFREALKNSPF